ncbi:MAG: ArsR family transcriptional regulator [Solirubrobacterales bacterium]|jgi:transposase-like protein|nr:ArsR family transcriptional regulator [Solirubrobacterales bacterium]
MDTDRLKSLLLAGTKRAEIAAELGVSPSTISRHARQLGHPSLRSPGSRFDWHAIQAFWSEVVDFTLA